MQENCFPLFVRMENRKVLLVGAGSVALRRAQGLLNSGAVLTVTAPEIAPGFWELRGTYGRERLEIRERAFTPGSIQGFDLALAATDDAEADLAVWRECREKKIPVNVASDRSLCDFYFPALVCAEDLVIGISSGGTDHGKVRRVSAKLREFFSRES